MVPPCGRFRNLFCFRGALFYLPPQESKNKNQHACRLGWVPGRPTYFFGCSKIREQIDSHNASALNNQHQRGSHAPGGERFHERTRELVWQHLETRRSSSPKAKEGGEAATEKKHGSLAQDRRNPIKLRPRLQKALPAVALASIYAYRAQRRVGAVSGTVITTAESTPQTKQKRKRADDNVSFETTGVCMRVAC